MNVSKMRQSNLELLRIICMLFIVCIHIVMAHGYIDIYDSSWYIKSVFQAITICAVDIFVLISGFFGIKLKLGKLWNLNSMVTFYSVSFLIMACMANAHSLTISKDWMYFLPLLTKKYWFVTCYLTLCIIAPFLNLFIERITQKQYRTLLISLFIILSVWPTLGRILNFPSLIEDSGYGIVNFVFLYFIGRYIYMYVNYKNYKKQGILLYVFSVLSLCVFQDLYSLILGFPFDALLGHDTCFVLFSAIGLFMYFLGQSPFRNERINKIAKYCLPVYIIHLNPFVFPFLMNDLLDVSKFRGLGYVLILLIYPIVVYIMCMALEYVRLRFSELFCRFFPQYDAFVSKLDSYSEKIC